VTSLLFSLFTRNGGGTYFTAAIVEITKLLKSDKVDPNLEVAVVFMTDGQDGSRGAVPAAMGKFTFYNGII
jgi:uncharacterized protein with von Willebrand factor type A (vWA) domain